MSGIKNTAAAIRHARQLASRRVTRQPVVCDRPCCTEGPRRPNHMLVNYACIKDGKS